MSQPVVDFLSVSHPLTTTFSFFTLRAESFFLWFMSSVTKNITLGMHQFCDDVSYQLCYLSPRRYHFIKTCIQNGVLIGCTNWVTIGIIPPTYSLWPFCPLSGVMFPCLNTSPPTLGLSLVLHLMWGMSLPFFIHIVWIIL